jgi:hypothetical protein
MTAGRPPVPNELKRAIGRTATTTAGGRALPAIDDVHGLPAAVTTPPYPQGLGRPGKDLWDKAWAPIIIWLSPASDMVAVERACRLADAFAEAGREYSETGNFKTGEMFVKLSKELGTALGELGFSPASRTKLGVAEVKKMSKLDELRRRHQESGSTSGRAVIDVDFTE